MKKKFIVCCIIILIGYNGLAQSIFEYQRQVVEVGANAGGAFYFGDLNPNYNISHPRQSFGIFIKKKISKKANARLNANYLFLSYTDIYNSSDKLKLRNLSFNTDVIEFSAGIEYNFYEFLPGLRGAQWTPYVFVGVGTCSYNPYAYMNNIKYYLKEYGTEGQDVSSVGNTKSAALCVPVALGLKFALTRNLIVGAELNYRFTNTDYIDNVSKTYPGANFFNSYPADLKTVAYQLSDRSWEITGGTPMFKQGDARGNNAKTDNYMTFSIFASFNFYDLLCPSARR